MEAENEIVQRGKQELVHLWSRWRDRDGKVLSVVELRYGWDPAKPMQQQPEIVEVQFLDVDAETAYWLSYGRMMHEIVQRNMSRVFNNQLAGASDQKAVF